VLQAVEDLIDRR